MLDNLINCDCLYKIIIYLDDYDIFKLLQVNKKFLRLKEKRGLWQKLWNYKYPLNTLIDRLTEYQNFLRCTLVKKYMELNNKTFHPWWNHILKYSESPKRRHDRAMFIPMIAWLDFLFRYYEQSPISENIRQAFILTELHLTEVEIHDSLKLANFLLDSKQLMLEPEKGDILAFNDNPLMVYDGKKIIYCDGFDEANMMSDIGLAWPMISIDYWYQCAMIPKELYHQFKSNIQYKNLPIDVVNKYYKLNPNVYSSANCNNQTLYLFFEQYIDDFTSDNFEILWNWNRWCGFNSSSYDLMFSFGRSGDMQYLLLLDHDHDN